VQLPPEADDPNADLPPPHSFGSSEAFRCTTSRRWQISTRHRLLAFTEPDHGVWPVHGQRGGASMLLLSVGSYQSSITDMHNKRASATTGASRATRIMMRL
jgi:hypothetical protein